METIIMSKKILIVDDDTYLRELYEEVLKSEGFDVEMAGDGEEGLMKMQQGGYIAILLDLMMPKIDGLGILDSLAKNPPKQKNGPIILLSNLSHDPLIKTAKTKGASAYMIKADITPDQIVAKIKDLIQN